MQRTPGAWTPPIAAGVTVVILALGLLAPLLPVTADEHAPSNLVQRALGFDALRSLPGWWSTVLPVLVAVACLDAAGRRSGRARRRSWALLGVLLSWLSVDHLVTIPRGDVTAACCSARPARRTPGRGCPLGDRGPDWWAAASQ